jgi:hypothetical protein
MHIVAKANLERLELPLIDDRQVTQARAAALPEKKGLVHLEVYFRAFDEINCTLGLSFWNRFHCTLHCFLST